MTGGLSEADRQQIDELTKQLESLLQRAMKLLEKANPEKLRGDKLET
jgi:hypothetical protein